MAAVKSGIVSKDHIHGLSVSTVYIFLPCLIFAKTFHHFNPSGFTYWWLLPIIGALLILIGILFCMVLFKMNPHTHSVWPLASIQNAVYLPLPVGLLLYPDQFDTFAVYCFLIIVGTTPVMWILGKVLMSGQKNTRILWKDFVTPPTVALLVSIFAVFSGLVPFIPDVVISSMELLGQATLPLAVFVLGGTLATITITDMPSVKDTAIVVLIKFILIPATVFSILYLADLNAVMPLFCSLMIIQASSPSATNLILIVKHYRGDSKSISSMMLLQHLFCIFALPFWLALWQWVVS